MDHFTFLLIYYCRSDDHWVVWRAANEHKVALKKLETMGTITVEEAVKEIRRRSMKLISSVPKLAPRKQQIFKQIFQTNFHRWLTKLESSPLQHINQRKFIT